MFGIWFKLAAAVQVKCSVFNKIVIWIKKGMGIMRERENWDVLCEECDKTIERGVATESGDNYCDSCYDKLAYGNKEK